MGTYILMTKMTPEISADLKRREAIGKAWKKQVAKLCPDVKWQAHYALLGPYDFMDIYQAKNEETAAKVSLISRANGALKAESWPAIEWNRFITITKEIGI
ncbi:MAG: GYD domain-containing protein [Candidatus Aminicenantes bacterium]|nr:GYD domain-containing protein [Candidatus Aminicenantes bacterium]